LIASKSYISSILIYGKNEEPLFFVYTDQSNGNRKLSEVKTTDFYKICHTLKGKPYWHSINKEDTSIIVNNTFDKFAMSRAIVEPLSQNNYYQGFLFITFNHEVIDNSLATVINAQYESVVIYSESGELIYTYGRNFPATKLSEARALQKDTTVTDESILSAYKLDNTDWTIYYITDKEYYTRFYSGDTTLWLVIILLCAAVSLPISLLFSTYLSAPIRRLRESMEQFEKGDFEASVPVTARDEIGELSNGYNKMVLNIKRLVNELYVLELKEREAELKALQSQINPHFLYNSLNTIYWKALQKNEKDISEMVFSLSKIFRLLLNRGEDLITVLNEVELIKHYLVLQKIRFKNQLEYTIHVEEEIASLIIPKLIIQPFVENSIIHGIEPMDTQGHIAIDITKHEKSLQISIIDNGVGFILNDEDSENHSGYAIKNIRERLTLIYESNYKLNISSELGKGTQIMMILPIKEV